MVSATIDTAALKHNLQVIRQVGAALARHGGDQGERLRAWAGRGRARARGCADSFAVARVDEGLTLRNAGICKRTVLLEGVFDREQLEAAAAAGFELVVHTAEQIELLREARRGRRRFKVWLKLDSGMNRLGFKGTAFEAAAAALSVSGARATPVNLFTHLASRRQTGACRNRRISSRALPRPSRSLPGERSIANSAGMLSFPEAQADWVRPGLLLYGVSPFAGSIGADYGLRPAMTLRSHVIAVKESSPGEQVGYGGDWTARRPTRLAVAAVGYGDGYPRSLASGSPVLVNGERAPLAGRVSMDMIGIDVTDLKRSPKLGDPVILWGAGLPVEEIAVWADTIPYELLCGISQRVAVTLRG